MAQPLFKIDFEPGSFKDPFGSVFYFGDKVYRTLSAEAYELFNQLQAEGIIEKFCTDGFLIESELLPETGVRGLPSGVSPSGYLIAQPRIPYIAYPYEWCFSQLREAALKTLDFLEACLEKDLVLKDATAFNLALYKGELRFFDVLSIERYTKNEPWKAYRQFCQQFLYPLMLTAYKELDVQYMTRGFMQSLEAGHVRKYFHGLDVFKPGVLKHLYLQAMLEKNYAAKDIKVQETMKQTTFPKSFIINNVRNLRGIIQGLSYHVPKSEWSDYIRECNYEDSDRRTKHEFVSSYMENARPESVIDLGCNTGEYSCLAARIADMVISVDSDALSIERLYGYIQKENITNIVPIVGNILNPSPSMGWQLEERQSFMSRFGNLKGFLALALVHHICISGNVPVEKCVEMLRATGETGVVEWVDKKDGQVQKLLRNREDVFGDYNWPAFKSALERHFRIVRTQETHGGNRVLCQVQAI